MKNKFLIYFIPLFTLLGLTIGLILHLYGQEKYDHYAWMATLVFGTIPLAVRMVKDTLKGHFGIDLIAIVAIFTSFFLGEYLAGSVIVLMLSGGEALEDYALKRSSLELTKLLSLAPTIGHLKINGALKDINADQIKVNDILIVKPGETVPVDGVVINGASELDESTITGESVLSQKSTGSMVYSGSINKDSVIEITAQKLAGESQYQRIVKLIKEAQNSRSPIVRLADRWAVWFTLLTLILSTGAWFISGEAIRFLAVLVVATPCPLILATPIAIISGISKSASRGIIVKNGGSLEKLGEAEAIIYDKTGTLTLGEPKVLEIISFHPNFLETDILNLSASLDQLSVHALGRALVSFAKTKPNIKLTIPNNLKESLGNGVSGDLLNKKYTFGKLDYLKSLSVEIPKDQEIKHIAFQEQGKISVYLAQDNKLLGVVIFSDILRPEIKRVFSEIQKHKIKKIFMLTGDKLPVAKKIAEQLGITDFKAEMLPEDKVKEVIKIKSTYSPVAMVGDGVNDAPALTASDVGIAMAAHGSSAASENADMVIMQNNLMRVHDALHIAQSVMRIAKQSIYAGLGLSIILMIFASFGYIKPVYGALLQEIIDVAVILNALRVNFEKVA